jgi:prophage maintenance system killer protein
MNLELHKVQKINQLLHNRLLSLNQKLKEKEEKSKLQQLLHNENEMLYLIHYFDQIK